MFTFKYAGIPINACCKTYFFNYTRPRKFTECVCMRVLPSKHTRRLTYLHGTCSWDQQLCKVVMRKVSSFFHPTTKQCLLFLATVIEVHWRDGAACSGYLVNYDARFLLTLLLGVPSHYINSIHYPAHPSFWWSLFYHFLSQ